MCTVFVMVSVCVKFHVYVIFCKFVKFDDVPAMPSQKKKTNMTQHTMGLLMDVQYPFQLLQDI